MTTEEQKLNKDEETLVAYLDGELSEAEIIEVEKRLTTCEKFRKQLNGLERTWDMLDALPAVEPTAVSYTHLTLPTIYSV